MSIYRVEKQQGVIIEFPCLRTVQSALSINKIVYTTVFRDVPRVHDSKTLPFPFLSSLLSIFQFNAVLCKERTGGVKVIHIYIYTYNERERERERLVQMNEKEHYIVIMGKSVH